MSGPVSAPLLPSTFLIHVSSAHPSFRIPELTSIAKLFDFPLEIVSDHPDSGLVIVKIGGSSMEDMWENGRKMAGRCICVKSVHSLIACGSSYSSLLTAMHSLPQPQPWEADRHASFYIDLKSFGHHPSSEHKRQTFASLSFLDFRGKAQMKGADVTYTIFEDYEKHVPAPMTVAEKEKTTADGTAHGRDRDRTSRMIYFTKLVAEGTARKLIDKFDVKRRAFYGNTSMESEMSLLMANQALASPEKLIYDPFAGTGSMLYTSAWFGAMVLGSDIDGRQMRGKAPKTPIVSTEGVGVGGKADVIPGIYRAAEQYDIRHRIMDCLTFDVTRCPWREVSAATGFGPSPGGVRGGWIDAIVTDPPYGVRAGAKRQGRKEGKRPELVEPVLLGEGGIIAVNGRTGWAHEQPDYVPPFSPYELSHLIYDLLVLSRWLLVEGGRLVFFLPTMTPIGEWSQPEGQPSAGTGISADNPQEIPLELPVVEGMREIVYGSGSAQDFGRWSRRLITFEKVGGTYPRPDFVPQDRIQQERKVPGHHMFRERFFDKSLDQEVRSATAM